MKRIQIFDPAMCCSTGVCGPSINPDLLRMSFVVSNLTKQNYPIERFNLSTAPDAFIANEVVNSLLNEKGVECLPIILVDGEIAASGRYPTNEELEEWTGIAAEELTKKPRVRLSLDAVKKETL